MADPIPDGYEVLYDNFVGVDGDPPDAAWVVATGGDASATIQSGRLRLRGTGDGDENGGVAMAITDLDPVTDGEMLTGLQVTAGMDFAELWFRSEVRPVAQPVAGGYGLTFQATTAHIHRQQPSTGASVTFGTFGLSGVVDPTQPFWVRYQITDNPVAGVDVRVRVWQQGDPEPVPWTVDETDTNPVNGGPIYTPGQATVRATSGWQAVARDMFIDRFRYSTFEAPPPPPPSPITVDGTAYPRNRYQFDHEYGNWAGKSSRR